MHKFIYLFLIIAFIPSISSGENTFTNSKEYKNFQSSLKNFRKGNFDGYHRLFKDVSKRRSKYRSKEIKLFAKFGLGYIAFVKNRKFDIAKIQFKTVLDKLQSFSKEQKKNFWLIIDELNLKITPERLGKLSIKKPEDVKFSIVLFEYIAQIFETTDTVYSIQNAGSIRNILLDQLESANVVKSVEGHQELYELIIERFKKASIRLQELTPVIFDSGKAQQ